MRRPGYVVVALAALVSCATLDKLPESTCGNAVVDPNEDCDSFAVSNGSQSYKCGAPGTPSACRFTCDTDADCPDGWGCSVDHVCREPTGSFSRATDPVSSDIAGLHIGDFDGDGRKDVLGTGVRAADNTSRARILYFGDNAALEHTTLLSAPIASPSIRNFDRDSDNTDDFAFGALAAGFGIMTGRKDRSVVPILFPSVRIENAEVSPVVVRGIRRQIPNSELDTSVDPTSTWTFLFAGKLALNGQTGFVLASGGDPAASYFHTLTGANVLLGGPVWGDVFDQSVESTCGEVVVAYNTPSGGQIQTFSPCKNGVAAAKSVWAPERDPTSISLTEQLQPGMHVADVDGDGHLDVMFSTRAGVVQVAHGDGKRFGAPLPDLSLTEVPIASGDLNGDGVIDYVTPSSIVLSLPLGLVAGDGGPAPIRQYTHITSARRTKWTIARFGNIGGGALGPLPPPGGDGGAPPSGGGSNGKAAFVACASASQPDIDYFQGLPTPAFPTASTIATNGPVSFLEVADFDGDTLDDVAFVETSSATSTSDLAYAYGHAVGPPDPPTTVGAVANAVAVTTTPDLGPRPLAVFTRETVAADPLATTAAAIVIGSGDRQPLAPLLLTDAPKAALDPLPPGSPLTRRWAPMSVITGAFQTADRIDLAAVAVGYTFDATGELLPPPFPVGTWSASGTGTATFDVATQIGDFANGATAGIEALDSKTYAYDLTVVAGDIDAPKNGVLEIVGLGRTKTLEPDLLVVRPPAASGSGKPEPLQKLTSLAQDGFGLISPSLRLLDVDGDGNLDAIVTLGDGTPPATGQAQTKIVVYFNDGAGGFKAPPGLALAIPPAAAPAEGGAPRSDIGPVSLAQITIAGASPTSGGKRTTALLVATQHRLLLAKLRADKSGFDVVDLTPQLFGDAGLRGATGVAAGDFDGDGVDDIAVADDGAVRIARQVSSQAARTP